MSQNQKKIFAATIRATLLIAIVIIAHVGFLIANELANLINSSTTLYIREIEVPNSIAALFVSRDALLLVLSSICAVVYVRFCIDGLHTRTLFSRLQTHRMLGIGLTMLASSAISFICDSITQQLLPASMGHPLGVFIFNPWMLVVSLFALSLSFIFEYGRLLQEDNDSII